MSKVRNILVVSHTAQPDSLEACVEVCRHLREDAIRAVLWSAFDAGLGVAGLIPSPILGGHGNHEYLVWLSANAGLNPSEWDDTVHRVAGV